MRGVAHRGIIRLVGISARRQGEFAMLVLQRYGDELGRGALITVDTRRVRIRK